MVEKRKSPGIDVNALDQQILDLGIRVRVWKSALCPNLQSLESNDHDLNCRVCRERMIDFAPECTMALFQQQSLAEAFKVTGSFHVDEVMASFLSGVTLQSMARVDLLDFPEDFYELIQKQEGGVDRLKYNATCVLGLFTVQDDVKTEFHCDTDFVITQDGNIKWISAHQPEPRQVYSIYYKYLPIYRATKGVHRDRFSQPSNRTGLAHAVQADGKVFAKLPEQWVLRRSYLLDKRNRVGSLDPDNINYDPNEEP